MMCCSWDMMVKLVTIYSASFELQGKTIGIMHRWPMLIIIRLYIAVTCSVMIKLHPRNCSQTASASWSKINAKCHRCYNNCNCVAFSWWTIIYKLRPKPSVPMQCLHNKQNTSGRQENAAGLDGQLWIIAQSLIIICMYSCACGQVQRMLWLKYKDTAN